MDLSKRYDKLVAVDSLNLEIREGEVFGVLGPNGAGKTTVIHMLATLLKPSSGSGFVNGFDIRKQPGDVRRSIGIVFQIRKFMITNHAVYNIDPDENSSLMT